MVGRHCTTWEVCCCCCWCEWKFLKLTRLHTRTGSPASGTTGRLSQLHISIMNPSGSWKKIWSTKIPPSSTVLFTYSMHISFNFFSTMFMLSHFPTNQNLSNILITFGIRWGIHQEYTNLRIYIAKDFNLISVNIYEYNWKKLISMCKSTKASKEKVGLENPFTWGFPLVQILSNMVFSMLCRKQKSWRLC